MSYNSRILTPTIETCNFLKWKQTRQIYSSNKVFFFWKKLFRIGYSERCKHVRKHVKKKRMDEWMLTIVADKRSFHDGKCDYNPRKMRTMIERRCFQLAESGGQRGMSICDDQVLRWLVDCHHLLLLQVLGELKLLEKPFFSTSCIIFGILIIYNQTVVFVCLPVSFKHLRWKNLSEFLWG